MDKILNKIKNLSFNIINSKNNILKIMFDILNNFDILQENYYYIYDKYDIYNLIISHIPFTELNAYCEYGYNIPDTYIIYNYINKNKEQFENLITELNNFDYDDYNKIDFKEYIVYYILFLTDEDLYNKLFKDIFKITRKELFDKITNIYNNDYYKTQYNIDYETYINEINLRNINFYKGDLFLQYQNIFYYIIFDSKYNKEVKNFLIYELIRIFNKILKSIINICFLPFNFILNNSYNKIYYDKYYFKGYNLRIINNDIVIDISKNINKKSIKLKICYKNRIFDNNRDEGGLYNRDIHTYFFCYYDDYVN